jgi:hypothetical protein
MGKIELNTYIEDIIDKIEVYPFRTTSPLLPSNVK